MSTPRCSGRDSEAGKHVNFLFVLVPRMLEWHLAVMRRLRRDLPDARFYGLVTMGKTRDVEALERMESSGLLSDIFNHAARERGWLSRSGSPENLLPWERLLGPGSLNRILLCDRHLCAELVQADTVPVALARAARDDRCIRAYLTGMLSDLEAYLERHTIDCVFAFPVADAPVVALAELCRVKGLQFLRLTNARLYERHVVDERAPGTLSVIEARYRAARTNPSLVDRSLPDARRYLAEFRGRPREQQYLEQSRAVSMSNLSVARFVRRTLKLPVYMSRWHRRGTDSMRAAHPVDMWKMRLRQVLRGRDRLDRWLSDVEGVPGRLAFYPLHVEPEASTMVMAPTLPNQLAIIEGLVRSLPVDMTLLVKEHPTMIGRRPQRSYQQIAKLPRCRLVDPGIPGVDLVRKAALTCTISSTAAWEAMLLGRPALVFGTFPFTSLGEGVVQCSDFTALPGAVAKALSQPPVQERNLELYVAAILELGFDFPAKLLWGRATEETVRSHPEISDAVADGILYRIQAERPHSAGRSRSVHDASRMT